MAVRARRGEEPLAPPPDGAERPLEELRDGEVADPAGWVANLVVALLVTGAGVGVVVAAAGQGLGSASAPGPGTLPFLLGLVLLALGVVLGLRCRGQRDAERFDRRSVVVVAAAGTLVAYVVLVPRLGFEIPSVLMALVWLRFIGRESWRLSVVVSVVTVACFYALFVGALAVPLPHLF